MRTRLAASAGSLSLVMLMVLIPTASGLGEIRSQGPVDLSKVPVPGVDVFLTNVYRHDTQCVRAGPIYPPWVDPSKCVNLLNMTYESGVEDEVCALLQKQSQCITGLVSYYCVDFNYNPSVTIQIPNPNYPEQTVVAGVGYDWHTDMTGTGYWSVKSRSQPNVQCA